MKNVAIFTEEYFQFDPKIERTLTIDNKEIASEKINGGIKTKLSSISELMQDLSFGREFKLISKNDWNVILDVFKSSDSEYFEKWLLEKISNSLINVDV